MNYNNTNVQGNLTLKVDTGAAGNTLPLRTYKQMFGDIPPKQILSSTTVKLTVDMTSNVLVQSVLI